MILDVESFEGNPSHYCNYAPITGPDALGEKLLHIKEQVWGEGGDEFILALESELRDMGQHMRIYAAQRDDQTIGCGLIRYNEPMTFGGLLAGATVPDERGKGVNRGIVSARVDDARERGTRYLYTEAGAMSRPILERLGFKTMSTITNYVR